MEKRIPLLYGRDKSCWGLHLLVNQLDRLRAALLKILLQFGPIKRIYQVRHQRILFSYLAFSLLYFIFSLLRPDLLLVFGPLIYGYWHLITSYKYTASLSFNQFLGSEKERFVLKGLLAITFLEIIFRVSNRYLNLGILIPNGLSGLTLSLLFALYLHIRYQQKKNWPYSVIALALISSIILFSWREPLAFVSLVLFSHNFIAFLAWLKFSRDTQNRKVALYSLLFFSLIHLLVALGLMDPLLSLFESSYMTNSSYQNYAWLLAPWSDQPIIWKRALCLYTFGLSIHYFIWLKAIPENAYPNRTPVSFKKSLESFNKHYGKGLAPLILSLSVVATIVWLTWMDVGSLIYFSLSNIHMWTEFIMLLFSLSLYGFRGPNYSATPTISKISCKNSINSISPHY